MKLFARLLLVVILFVAVGTVYSSFADNSVTHVIKKNSQEFNKFLAIVPTSVNSDPDYRVFAIIYPGDDVLNGYRQDIKPTNNSPPSSELDRLGLNIKI